MKFRTSIGQNLLEHSLEVSAIMGLMAGELHLNVQAARRIGLLHDIGKVISHEVEGTHALVGADIAAKFGELKLIVNGIACHHGECPAESIEASLCKPADAISAARLGARQGKVEGIMSKDCSNWRPWRLDSPVLTKPTPCKRVARFASLSSRRRSTIKEL